MSKDDFKKLMDNPDKGRAVIETLIYADPLSGNTNPSELSAQSSSIRDGLGMLNEVKSSNGYTIVSGDKYIIEFKELG